VLRVVLPKNPVLRWLKIGTAQLNQVEYLSLHSIAAVSLNADLLMADVCMVARAGQGRAGQGRAGQHAQVTHITKGAVSIGWSEQSI